VPDPGRSTAWGKVVTIRPDGTRSNGTTNVAGAPIVAVGGSFTFGDEVDDRDTCPTLYGHMTPLGNQFVEMFEGQSNSWMARSGEGCREFRDASGGTRIDWSYEVELTTPLAHPIALIALASQGAWMKQGLAVMRADLAGSSATEGPRWVSLQDEE